MERDYTMVTCKEWEEELMRGKTAGMLTEKVLKDMFSEAFSRAMKEDDARRRFETLMGDSKHTISETLARACAAASPKRGKDPTPEEINSLLEPYGVRVSGTGNHLLSVEISHADGRSFSVPANFKLILGYSGYFKEDH